MNDTLKTIYSRFKKSIGIGIDSRKVKPGMIFFAIKGDNFDGNSFAASALENGAELAVIDNASYFQENGKYFLVDDSLDTLQKLASYHRSKFDVPVIAITGSNGKTTTKELIARVLSEKFIIKYTQGNLNNHIGLPLTLLDIDHKTQVVVLEMGANHQGEIAMLCELARPEYGIITNIGKAHLEGFGGYNGVIKAKSELYRYIQKHEGTLFVNSGDALLMKLSDSINRITYGSKPGSDYEIK
jgi:UDP-N-acetylmuramoyl-tripeptide--D-alanyl-D-alanine ligase